MMACVPSKMYSAMPNESGDQDMTQTTIPFALQLTLRALAKTYRADDQQALSDDELAGAITGRRPLDSDQWQQLLHSPATARRMQVLANRLSQAAPPLVAPIPQPLRRVTAANDAEWHSSAGVLRAAYGEHEQVISQLSEDGRWRLLLLHGGERWRIGLCLEGDDKPTLALREAQPHVRVLDGSGVVLLAGQLDIAGEMDGEWTQALDPVAHLATRGNVFSVERA